MSDGPVASRAWRPALTFLSAVLLSATLVAQDPSADKALERLKATLAAEQGLSAETKAAMAAFFEALSAQKGQLSDADVAALKRLTLQAPQTASRWDTLKDQITVSGDLRLRGENNSSLDTQDRRRRFRTRLRVAADYKLDPSWSIGARLRTGDPGDPNSPHTTWGDVFDSEAFTLDRAFAVFRPESAEGLKFMAGKFAHPFFANPVYGELVWDADINPEGFAGVYTLAGDEAGDKLDIALGHYIAVETAASDATIYVGQVAGTTSLGASATGTLAVGYYDYGSTSQPEESILAGDNPSQTAGGNVVLDLFAPAGPADTYASEFEIVNVIAATTFTNFSQPVTLSAEYIENWDAFNSDDSGAAVGVAVGQQKKAGDWQWYWQWQTIEQEAVFAAFAQDDLLLAANHNSHVFGTRYRVRDNVGAHLWFLVSQRDTTGNTLTTDNSSHQWRTRLDLDVRF